MGKHEGRIGVIMAGGSGERFWPLSQPGRPKQLLKLTDPDRTMIQEAVDRVLPVFGGSDTYIATSSPLMRPISEANLLPVRQILCEPAKRNTLGAHCWLVANLLAVGRSEATVAVLTSDHAIGEPEVFRKCISDAMEIAENSSAIVTLGIPPTRPETGYGYIEEDPSNDFKLDDGRVARPSKSFREKPSVDLAAEFVSSGSFLWNSGMFFYTIPVFLHELKHAHPYAHVLLLETAYALSTGRIEDAVASFEKLPNLSIDYALMEKAQSVLVIRADFPWDDVGAWDAVARNFPADSRGNVCLGDVIEVDSTNVTVVNESSDRPLAVLGLKNVIVVQCDHGVLVCDASVAQNVRLITTALRERGEDVKQAPV